MDISLNDLKAALSRAQDYGHIDTDEMAAFAFGYLSAGPLGEPGTDNVTEEKFKVGDRVIVGANDDYSPTGPGTLNSTYIENGETWWKYTSDGDDWGGWAVREEYLTSLNEPQVGDTVRVKQGAVGDGTYDHSDCWGTVNELYQGPDGKYDNGFHVGPLSDFEKVEGN